MKVKVPIPWGSENLYELVIENRTFWSKEALEEKLKQIEGELDDVCEKQLKSGEYMVVDYSICVGQIHGKNLFALMIGGFDISVEPRTIDHFMEEYKSKFKKAAEKYEVGVSVNIVVEITGSFDKTVREVDAKDPNSS